MLYPFCTPKNKNKGRPLYKLKELLEDYTSIYGVNTWAMSTYEARRSLIFNYINPIIGDVKLSDLNTRMMEKYYQNLLKVKSRVVNNRKGLKGTG